MFAFAGAQEIINSINPWFQAQINYGTLHKTGYQLKGFLFQREHHNLSVSGFKDQKMTGLKNMGNCMWQRYLECISKSVVLGVSLLLFTGITFGLFKNLPDLTALHIDRMFSYSRADILQVLADIGPEGRATYRWANYVDTIFPLFYGSFFIGFLHRFAPEKWRGRMIYVPLVLAVTDIAETIQIGFMVRGYPHVGDVQALVSSGFTSLKHCLLYVTLLLFFIVLTGKGMWFFRKPDSL